MSFGRFPIWRIALFAAVLLLAPLGTAGPAHAGPAHAGVADLSTMSVAPQSFLEPTGGGLQFMNVEVTLDHAAGGTTGFDFGLIVTSVSAHGVQNDDGFGHPLTACPDGADFLFGTTPHGETTGHFGPTSTNAFVSFPICGDITPEPDETFTVKLCCQAQEAIADFDHQTPITIVDDDTPPRISIGGVTKSEGTQKSADALFQGFGTTPFDFPVTLSRAFGAEITIPYTVRDGVPAHHTSSCVSRFAKPTDLEDFTGPSAGTLAIPAHETTATISVPVCADLYKEGDETFSVQLGAPSAGTFAASTGVGVIVNDDVGAGTFRLAPGGATARGGTEVTYRLRWTVPKPHAWRALRTIDLRLLDAHPAAIWLRWAEASNTFRLVGPTGRTVGKAGRAGTPLRLAGRLGTLNLETSSVAGSGPHGRSVTLTLGLDLQTRAAGHTFRVEAAATDDLGHADAFRTAGTLAVK